MRLPENGIERQRSGQTSHHPADRRVAEILIGGKRINLQEAGGRAFEALVHLRLEVIVLVEAAQIDHGVHRAGIEREEDERLGLLPRAGCTDQHHPGLAIGAYIFPVQLLLEKAWPWRWLVPSKVGGDRPSDQEDNVVVTRLDDGEVRTVQASIVDPVTAARRVGVVDECHVGMRIERVDEAAACAPGHVAHVGVLRALEELGRRRIATVLDIEPGNGRELDRDHRKADPDKNRDPAEDALLHRCSISTRTLQPAMISMQRHYCRTVAQSCRQSQNLIR